MCEPECELFEGNDAFDRAFRCISSIIYAICVRFCVDTTKKPLISEWLFGGVKWARTIDLYDVNVGRSCE